MIAYHEALSGTASRIKVFHRGTLRQYGTCMTEYRFSFIHRWAWLSLFQLKWVCNITLSPFIFMVIMEEISKSIWENLPWCMLFADDIVLVAETKEEANSKLEEWKAALEGKWLRKSIEDKIFAMRLKWDRTERWARGDYRGRSYGMYIKVQIFGICNTE